MILELQLHTLFRLERRRLETHLASRYRSRRRPRRI